MVNRIIAGDLCYFIFVIGYCTTFKNKLCYTVTWGYWRRFTSYRVRSKSCSWKICQPTNQGEKLCSHYTLVQWLLFCDVLFHQMFFMSNTQYSPYFAMGWLERSPHVLFGIPRHTWSMIQHFNWVILGIPVENCIVGILKHALHLQAHQNSAELLTREL